MKFQILFFLLVLLHINVYPQDEKVFETNAISKAKNQNHWLGKYTFSLEVFRMGEHHYVKMNFLINSLKDIDVITYVDKKKISSIKCEGVDMNNQLTMNSINLNSKKEYLITKDDNEYSISGNSITLLNPPNDEYSLVKISNNIR
ncbi:MAG: hypothetical protein NT103_00425 [Campylobacterales bacterium]|jgi:hypothetical protein|nr:hypothetical protein [Campylobacterales bacterium]